MPFKDIDKNQLHGKKTFHSVLMVFKDSWVNDQKPVPLLMKRISSKNTF